MKRTFRIAKPSLVAGVILALSVVCGAQDAGSNRAQPHFSGQVPGEAQTLLRKFVGSVRAVDRKGMTLTIKSAERDYSFKLTSKTKFTSSGKSASLKDVGVSKTVEVVVNVRAQPNEAITVNIKENKQP